MFENMLYDKIISKLGRKHTLNDEQFDTYNELDENIQKLCDETVSNWDIIHKDWFDKVRKGYFVGGVVAGLIGAFLSWKVYSK